MKAEIQGIKVEGTAEEIAEVIRLVGAVKEYTTFIQFAPVDTTPKYPPPHPWTQVTCEGTTRVLFDIPNRDVSPSTFPNAQTTTVWHQI